jgi:CheY-like chemotaxis protein
MNLLPKNILAIDDSLTLRRFIERSLAGQPFVNQLALADCAQAGLEMAETFRPELILCDYTLPDMPGDILCNQLHASPAIAATPIVLMSSSGQEITELAQRNHNIARVLVKPFSAELLIATTAYVLGNSAEATTSREIAASTGQILFRGLSSSFPLTSALRDIEKHHLTGVLRAAHSDLTVYAYCEKGALRMVSTRTIETYLAGSPYWTRGRKSPIWERCSELQRSTGSPFLLNLADEGVLPEQTATTLTELYGHRLFARLWVGPGDVAFEFEEMRLPEFATRCRRQAITMDDWILENLRNVEQPEAFEHLLNDPRGIPVITLTGFGRLQNAPPNRDEYAILAQIDSSSNLTEICRRLRVTPDVAARSLFCFERLGVIDYWPSSVLEPPQN